MTRQKLLTPQPRLLWPLLATALILCWSSGYIGVRFASESADVMLVLFWRTLVAGVVLLPFALLIGPRITAHALLRQMAFGVATMFLYLGGFAQAIQLGVPTGLVALFSDLIPLAIAALSAPILGQSLSARQWKGTVIGLLGVLIATANSLSFGAAPIWAYGLAIAAMGIFALSSVLQKRLGAFEMPVHQSLCIQCLTGAGLFALVATSQGSLIPPLGGHFEIGILWLVLLSTFSAYGLYYTCLRLFPAAQVAGVLYLSPPVTMLWAWAMFGEPLSALMFVGLAVTLFGVWMTMARAPVSAEPAPPNPRQA
ncbi:DMT family transporter [Paracoccus aminophilus]|uniref:EamA domain-containing protein n=1 Tax=Paracoccus aminophilus JCM 7686 TaxID=1367847 RepID=S5Y4M0_PARAH|nr:DMT family transporter [Paracoccus aminophilus]AGT10685.1 hypothetical protein JCM7686_pAMI1p099 [Paracoccus aminophilus JCM 7686]